MNPEPSDKDYKIDPEYVHLAKKVFEHVQRVHEYYGNGEVMKADTELEYARMYHEQIEQLDDLEKW